MKKTIAIMTIVTGFAVSTALFAAISANSATLSKMKEGNKAFELTSELNPGESGLTSAPLEGKKTGDTLSAAEYNRVLEMLAAGGTGGGWESVSLSGSESFDASCLYRMRTSDMGGAEYRFSAGVGPDLAFFGYNIKTGWIGGSISKSNKGTFDIGGTYGTYTVVALDKNCGGIGGGSSGSSAKVAGFPNTIKCLRSDANEYRFLEVSGITTDGKIEYQSNYLSVAQGTLRFNADGSFESAGTLIDNTCKKSITQLVADGVTY